MKVWVGLGANLGPAEMTLTEATSLLKANEVSSLYASAPVGGPQGQPWYLNAVACLRWHQSLWSLLDLFWDVEREAGRRRTVANGPRELDLDIVAVEHMRVGSSQLQVPHPRASSRRFVMAPLSDIAPNLVAEWDDHQLEGEVVRVGTWNGSKWIHVRGSAHDLRD